MSLLDLATQIVITLADAGHVAYFAGGWVRDLNLGQPSDDIDIATSASVEEIISLFPKTIPVGVAFGIVVVVVEGKQFEVATFRQDIGYQDGRHPLGIEKSTPIEDAKRRDFTINGMFYDPLSRTLYDYVEGQKDIQAGLIRAIGDPQQRFLEDRLRMIRAARYATRFKFSIDPQTYQAIQKYASTLFPSVAIERVYQELEKMARFRHLQSGLILLHELKLLSVIFPFLQVADTKELTKRLQSIPFFPLSTPLIGQLLELFPTFQSQQIEELCYYLKLSKQDRLFALDLHKAKRYFTPYQQWEEKISLCEQAHFYAQSNSSTILNILNACIAPSERSSFEHHHAERKRMLSNAIHRLKTNNPLVTSQILQSEGVLPGKKMGQLLKEAERQAINSNIENPREVIEILKRSPLW
jgi:poly(A) polymerase